VVNRGEPADTEGEVRLSKRTGDMNCFLFKAQLDTPKEILLDIMVDYKFMKIWDVLLHDLKQVEIEDNLVMRTLTYQMPEISSDLLVLNNGCFWGNLDEDTVFWTQQR